jgi:hypothetical protein
MASAASSIFIELENFREAKGWPPKTARLEKITSRKRCLKPLCYQITSATTFDFHPPFSMTFSALAFPKNLLFPTKSFPKIFGATHFISPSDFQKSRSWRDF